MNGVGADPGSLHSPTVIVRCMDDIPKVAFFEDHAQLLPIGQQTVFGPKASKFGSVGAHGQIAFRKFVCTHFEDVRVTTGSTSVYTNNALRQDELSPENPCCTQRMAKLIMKMMNYLSPAALRILTRRNEIPSRIQSTWHLLVPMPMIFWWAMCPTSSLAPLLK